MATITKTFASKLHSLSVTADGKNVNLLVEWPEQGVPASPGARPTPTSRTVLNVAGGKVSSLGKVVGPAPAEIGKLASELAAKVSALVEGLAGSGKIKP